MAVVPIQVVGTTTNPRLVSSLVAFDSNGDATVTAVSIGLNVILGCAGCATGGTTDKIAAVYASTTLTDAGVTTVALECREGTNAATADLNVNVPVLFWGR